VTGLRVETVDCTQLERGERARAQTLRRTDPSGAPTKV